jgi:hypothetical protein
MLLLWKPPRRLEWDIQTGTFLLDKGLEGGWAHYRGMLIIPYTKIDWGISHTKTWLVYDSADEGEDGMPVDEGNECAHG